jgi:DNA-directed RNA polymerase specialized sigma24 family protein
MALTSQGRWSLNRQALDRLLQRLGTEPTMAAQEYNKLRGKLLDFFHWRGAPEPEALADEAIDRIARKLEAGETVENLRSFVYGVGKRVWLEAEKRRAREQAALLHVPPVAPSDEPSEDSEARIACLRRCLAELSAETQTLIVGYYQGAGRSHLAARKLLATQLGMSYGNLRTRAHRLRGRLEGCVMLCLGRVTNGSAEPLSTGRAGGS